MLGIGTLARVARELRQDLTAAQDRDPAARDLGRAEILLTYGGVQALLVHRVAHVLHDGGIPLLPHALANMSKVVTGVEIHPAAQIGDSLFIHDGPPNSTVVGNPGHPVRVEGRRPGGPDADWAHLPDPVADAIKSLSARVTELEKLLAEATGKRPEPSAEVRPLRNIRGSDPAAG